MTTLAHDSDMEYIQLSRIERGQINTTLFQLFKISKALNIRLDELFKGVDEEVIFELNQKSTF
jgi:transcriptional regulator with XRE-family HTH domain